MALLCDGSAKVQTGHAPIMRNEWVVSGAICYIDTHYSVSPQLAVYVVRVPPRHYTGQPYPIVGGDMRPCGEFN